MNGRVIYEGNILESLVLTDLGVCGEGACDCALARSCVRTCVFAVFCRCCAYDGVKASSLMSFWSHHV